MKQRNNEIQEITVLVCVIKYTPMQCTILIYDEQYQKNIQNQCVSILLSGMNEVVLVNLTKCSVFRQDHLHSSQLANMGIKKLLIFCWLVGQMLTSKQTYVYLNILKSNLPNMYSNTFCSQALAKGLIID